MRNYPFRRTTIFGVVWMGVLAVLLLGQPAATVSGQEAVEPGRGEAYALGFKLDPRTGGLSLGLAFGESQAGHQNTLAIAEAKSLDLGLIGTILGGEGCDGGDPTLAEEDQPQALVLRTDEESGSASDTDLGVSREVSVNETPLARARAVVDGGELGALGIGATETVTTSGVVDGRRIARAVSTVSSIDLLGLVQIEGLRWVAEYQTEPELATVTEFGFGGITVAEAPASGLGPLDDVLGELTTQSFETLDAANAALELLGFRISPPDAFVSEGIAFVSPLRISVIPNETRDAVLGGLLEVLQPVREEMTAALFEIDCSTASLVTVADIVAGAVSGAGSLNIELGGVTATSGEIDVFQFGDFPTLEAPPPPPPPPPAPAPAAPPPAPAPPAPAPVTGVAETTPTTEAAPIDTEEIAAPVADTRPISGVRGGPLLWSGLAGLVLLGLLAEADRRKMRKAQQSAPVALGV